MLTFLTRLTLLLTMLQTSVVLASAHITLSASGEPTRATIGSGSVLMRDDTVGDSNIVAGLNRDTTLAQERTKDSEKGWDLYYSDQSFETLTDPSALVRTLRPDLIVANIASGTVRGIDQIDNALRDGLTIGGALSSASSKEIKQSRGLVDDGWVEDMARNTSASILASTSALQFYNNKGQLASMGANSSWAQRYDALRGTVDRHDRLRQRSEDGGVGKLEDGINNATDAESVAALQALAQDFTTAYGNKDTTASIYDDQTDSLAQGAKGFTARDDSGTRIGVNISHTDISDVDDLVTTLGKENYLAGEKNISDGSTREALAHLSGGRLGTMWTTDNQRRRLHTGGYKNRSSSDWRANINKQNGNQPDSLLRSNNQAVSRINPMNMEYRQLHYTEGRLIALTGAAFAFQQDISIEAGIRRLRERAMHQIDSAKDHALVGADDAAAATWLSDLSVAYLKDDKDAFDVELFGATQAQRDNHSLYAQHGNLVERQLKIGERLESAWSTEFINSEGANKYSQEELNHSRLGALARVELRQDIFVDNEYGGGQAIYAFRDASDNLRKIKALSAYELSNGIVLNPNDIRRIGNGNLHSGGFSVESRAAVEALGLKPGLMQRESSDWGAGWLSAEGHQDIFREAVRYATEGSATPLLVMATPSSNPYDLAYDASVELGRNLDREVRQIAYDDVTRMGVGQTLNLSRELEYATAATAMKNENFTSQFNQYVQERARNTSLLEDASANVTSAWSGVVDQTGQNWEIAFNDDAAPKYMRENAELGVAMDVLMLAPLVKGAVGTLKEVGKP